MDKDKLAIGSISAILGALLPAIISLNIFATKADNAETRAMITEVKAYVAEKYIQKSEVEQKLEKIEKAIERLAEHLQTSRGGK